METLRTTIVHKPRQITEKSAVSDLLHEALEERSRLNGGNKLYRTTS